MRVLDDICNNLEYQLEDIVKKGDILKLKEASGGGFAVSIIAKD